MTLLFLAPFASVTTVRHAPIQASRSFLWARICRYFQRLTISVRMISSKYIDTQTTSCYSFPCISNLILDRLLILFLAYPPLRTLDVAFFSPLNTVH